MDEKMMSQAVELIKSSVTQTINELNNKSGEYEKKIAELNDSVAAKDAEISELNEKLAAANASVAERDRVSDSRA